jgi:hypothetical protein
MAHVKNIDALSDASEKVGLDANPEKIVCMLMSRSQKTGQKHSIKMGNRSLENAASFKYLRKTLTHQNFMHKEIRWWMELAQD